MKQLITIAGLILLSYQTSYAQIDHNKVAEFVKDYAASSDYDIETLTVILNNAKYREDIVAKMERPAEGTMTWERYRNIFLKEDRIEAGVDFWKQHERVLTEVSTETGIPVEIIIGILGVETFFGQRIGSYRVLDALYTLAFGYPKRSAFFKAELGKFLELVKEENLSLYEVKGSCAGAIGYAQFMPSSYLAYARSYDNDGSKNLMEPHDAIASVANYLSAHRWTRDAPVVFRTEPAADAAPVDNTSPRLKHTMRYFSNLGYVPSGNISPDARGSLMKFELEEGEEYWIGLNNFYVITRYNHSPLYALAVYQLGQEIKQKVENL